MGQLAEYFNAIGRTILTCSDGLAVTFSHLFRKPITIQYPDRTAKPLTEMLPERSRGILEMDQELCTGCSLCSKQCPINCITIDVQKNAETKERILNKFVIDIGKCMFCGLCVEACKFSAIRHSKEFEGTVSDVNRLKINFVEQPAPVAKPKKGEDPVLKPVGSIIRKYLADQWAPAANKSSDTNSGGKSE
ncbi:MAG: 4Fe-4S binding protein [Fibrobacteria bacterium]|nr:4Fe-4S binding protein [Fibrobacteria bacterium]